MTQQFSDNARALLQGTINAAATSLAVETSKADRFPVANTSSWGTVNNWFKAVIMDAAGNREVIKVGVRSLGSGAFSNILRGQDGTTAQSFAAGSVVICTITAADIAAVLAGNFPSLNIAGGLDIGQYFHCQKRAYTDVVSQAFNANLSIDASLGNVFEIGDLTADITSLTVTNQLAGQCLEISVKQGGAGTYVVASPAGAKISGLPATGVGRVSKLFMRYSQRDSRFEGHWVPIAP